MGEFRSDGDRLEVLERKIKSQGARLRKLSAYVQERARIETEGRDKLIALLEMVRSTTTEQYKDVQGLCVQVLAALTFSGVDPGALDNPRLPKGEGAPATTIGERP